MKHLHSKTALITGGARRIGLAVANYLADAGADVVIHFNKSEVDANRLAAQIRSKGQKAYLVQGDLSDESAYKTLFKRAMDTAGPIDVLINNASIFHESTLRNFPIEELMREIEVNAYAPLVLSRAFAKQCDDGVIINLLDSRMNSYDATHAAYHLSKRMLYSITRMSALEFAPTIRVNAVAPGLILPPAGASEDYLETHKKENPLNCFGSVEAVAEATLYLATATFVTGQVIFVDGGRHLKSSVYG